ncbi:hypothetical protein NDU88_001809 [Pleurodeles waltl]|uniref:Uncharacterized protein n=1 Tax=Pleurodeles waltl TaxID=8319 RepID=A0AAV7RA56_PLEWA|nr:hypothetical protein NDU88_001809 [Pleurodeles waltl]
MKLAKVLPWGGTKREGQRIPTTRREKEAGLLRKRHGAGVQLELLQQPTSAPESRNASSVRRAKRNALTERGEESRRTRDGARALP